jgi:4'-phosphopantetheinyl transferase
MDVSTLKFMSCAAVLGRTGCAPAFRGGEVHVWACLLDGDAESADAAVRLLDAGERLRARRFAHETDRLRFVLAHGLLRTVLAGYCNARPAELVIVQSGRGKPSVDHPGGVQFNLAHSHDRALIAVRAAREVGIDIERVHAVAEAANVVARYFHPHERATLRLASSEECTTRFLQYWTAKEAVVKGHGTGLALALDTFAVDLESASGSVDASCCPPLGANWRVQVLNLGPGWVGAVAAQGSDWSIVPASSLLQRE